ncbi:hypothetical protein RRG08_023514 [Elysia crispata]|uniref:Uncharacterized protein n=1 Tax=Elysia crispata TaxID=231223 RepID=A0AAE0YZ95_9GAST|nr:hypothetical protein RRG08_023514 [Elysia crispata]
MSTIRCCPDRLGLVSQPSPSSTFKLVSPSHWSRPPSQTIRQLRPPASVMSLDQGRLAAPYLALGCSQHWKGLCLLRKLQSFVETLKEYYRLLCILNSFNQGRASEVIPQTDPHGGVSRLATSVASNLRRALLYVTNSV